MKFQAGKQQGDQIGWKENGDLRFKYTYLNGKRYGFMGSTLCQPPEGQKIENRIIQYIWIDRIDHFYQHQ